MIITVLDGLSSSICSQSGEKISFGALCVVQWLYYRSFPFLFALFEVKKGSNMPVRQIVPGLFECSLGVVNVFLLEDDDGLVLIDTGYPNSADKILGLVAEVGHQPQDIKQIVITHAHPDHIGSLAPLKRATGARVLVHGLDAPIVRAGTGSRKIYPSPGLLSQIMFRLFIRNPPVLEPVEVDHELVDGEELPIAGGIRVYHTPGHSVGQVAMLWPRHNVLFVGDACANMFGLGLSVAYEDFEEGMKSLALISTLDFSIACFGHGAALTQDAAAKFRKRWATSAVA